MTLYSMRSQIIELLIVLSVEFSLFTNIEIPVRILKEFLQILSQKVRLEMLKTITAPSIKFLSIFNFFTRNSNKNFDFYYVGDINRSIFDNHIS